MLRVEKEFVVNGQMTKTINNRVRSPPPLLEATVTSSAISATRYRSPIGGDHAEGYTSKADHMPRREWPRAGGRAGEPGASATEQSAAPYRVKRLILETPKNRRIPLLEQRVVRDIRNERGAVTPWNAINSTVKGTRRR